MSRIHRAPRASLAFVLVAASACGGSSGERASTASGLTAPAPSMTSGHVRGAGARLADGRVIVTGGWYPEGQRVDVYDPASDAWSAGPDMPTGHDDHAALALPDGRLAVAGGTGEGIDLYDPAAQTWQHFADVYRQYSGSALLGDGRILVAGGWDGIGAARASAVLLDPMAGTLQATGSLAIARRGHRAVALADGRALVVGGRNQAGSALSSVEAFDPSSGTFSPVAPMLTARSFPSATRLLDGRVLVAGGWKDGSYLASAEVYDPVADAWTAVGTMSRDQTLHSAVLLADGRVAVLGGAGTTAYSAAVEVFDPGTGTFGLADPLLKPRYYESCVLLASGRVLVAGGFALGESGQATSAEILDFGQCTPATCQALGKNCGTIADGCGGSLACGTCAAGLLCSANVCVACAPATCATLGLACGAASDGCGGTLECGGCPPGQACSGGICICLPTTCAAQAKECGTIPDGCGGTLACGTCPPGTICGAANTCDASSVASYDAARHAPRCAARGSACASGSWLVGRATLGPEANAPNTIDSCPDGTAGAFHSDESLDALRVATLDGSDLAAGATVRIEADVWAYGGYASDAFDLYLAANADSPSWTRIATLVPTKAGAQTLEATATLPRGGEVQAIRGVFRWGGSAAPCTAGPYDDHDDLLFAVVQPPDTLPPTVALTSPASGYVAGSVLLQASASDDVGVVRVAFLDGSTTIANAFSPPWSASWNTTVAANGPRTLTAVAYDAAGNTGSAARPVTVDNAKPSGVLTSPVAGAVLAGTVTLVASASDNEVVSRVEFYDGGALLGIRSALPWSLAWATAGAPDGTHVLSVKVYDGAGNLGVSPGVGVTVSNGGAPSAVAVYDPVRRAPACSGAAASCDSGTLLNGRAALGPEPHAPNSLLGSCADGIYGSYHLDESLDRLKVSSLDGGALAAGKSVRVEATVWVWGAASDRLDLYYAASADAPAWRLIGTLAPTASGLQTLTTTYVLPARGLQAVRGMYRYGGAPGPCVAGSFNDVDDLAFAVQ